MYWLWIPALVLIVIFILALCFLFFSDYSCCPCRRKIIPGSLLPTTVPKSVVPRALPRGRAPSAPSESPVLHLHHHGAVPLRQVLRTEEGFPTLDLHGMTVFEARKVTDQFLARNRGGNVRVVTGRGLHSEGGKSKIKPAILGLLAANGINATEIHNGGCLQIKVP